MPDAPPPLGPREAGDVLRYWLALLRHQEALSARPRARRAAMRSAPAPGAVVEPSPNLRDPARGQDYVKLPWPGIEDFLLRRQSVLRRELDAEAIAFFEHWLAARYRAAGAEVSQVEAVAFPVVLLGREELAGVFRMGVSLRFFAGDSVFEVRPEHRRAPVPPVGPTHFEIRLEVPETEEGLPLWLDTRLLRETLRVPSEELDALFERGRKAPALDALETVSRVTALLEAPLHETPPNETPAASSHTKSVDPKPSAAAVLARLEQALQARLTLLGGAARAYPVALLSLLDSSRATWHVQRDLEHVAEEIEKSEFRRRSPVWAFLSHEGAAGRNKPCVGRWPRAPVTASQRDALEWALGSRLAAIQGPPGTGKTTLIVNLVVHHWIEKLRILAEQGVMGEGNLLITSTNNRAVDTVLEPLGQGELGYCPLALRIGSREVLAQSTAPSLEKVRGWLEREPEAAPGQLSNARAGLLSALERVEALQAPRTTRWELQAALTALPERLAVEPTPGGLGTPRVLRSVERGVDAERVVRELGLLIQALEQLSAQCERAGSRARQRLETAFGRIEQRWLASSEAWLGWNLEFPLPPKPLPPQPSPPQEEPSFELWEENIERALAELREIEQEFSDHALAAAVYQERRERARRRAELEQRWAALPPLPAGHVPDEPELLRAFEELYQRGLELRLAWLRHNREPLLDSLGQAARHASEQRTLRGLLDSPKGPGRWLRQLFPAFGCTLLSLGNSLGPSAAPFEQVVVDEAGQCQAPYAISALLRGHSALLIGDVHQLEPVVGLNLDEERRLARSTRFPIDDPRFEPYRLFDESGNSAQSVADAAVARRPTLTDHFRCQPGIAALSESWCNYGMQVRTPTRSRRHQWPALSGPVLFCPIEGEQERRAGSWINLAEIEALRSWVGRALRAGIEPLEIGVITPFRSQSEAVFRALREDHIPLEQGTALEDTEPELFARPRGGVAVGTVHRFQGGERSLIVLSTTVTRTQSLPFLDRRVNLLNVAVTRAQDHLIVLGHERTLRHGRFTRALVERAMAVPGSDG
jgi:hypothetical protein